MKRSLELRIISESLELRIERRRGRLVTLEPTEGNVDHALLEVSNLNTSSVVFELDLVADTAHVMVGERSVQICRGQVASKTNSGWIHTCAIELEFFCNASTDAWVLPQAGAFNAGAGGARAVTRALNQDLSEALQRLETFSTYWLLKHATTDARAPFANFLDLSASGGGEATAHLGLGGLGGVAKLVHEALGLGVGIHRDRTGKGSCALCGSSQCRVVLLEAVEEELLLSG